MLRKQAQADDQTELSRVATQISKITQQVQMQANAAQTSDNLSLSTATAQIAASERKLQLVSSAAAKLKQGALQAESTFAQGLNQALAGGRTQHEKDWQANLDRVMAALAGTTLSGQISNGASYCWNIYVALNLGALQGVLNDLVLVGNTVVNADEFLLSPAGNLWYGKVFGLTNLQIPSARGLIINEPDWEYTWSQRFANAGIILVSLDLPIGGGGVVEGANELEHFGVNSLSKWKNTIRLGDDLLIDAYYKKLYTIFREDGGVIVRGVKTLGAGGEYVPSLTLPRILLEGENLGAELEELIHHVQFKAYLSEGGTIEEILAIIHRLPYDEQPIEVGAWEVLRSLGFRFIWE